MKPVLVLLKNTVYGALILGTIGAFSIGNPGVYLKEKLLLLPWFLPCRAPLTYSIASFDPRFGISKSDFDKAIKEAEAIWEKATGKNLFEEKDKGTLAISLVYDERQQETQKLASLNQTINTKESVFEKAKSDYEKEKTLYEQAESEYTSLLSSYTTRVSTYQKAVSASNARGGASKKEFTQFQNEKSALESLEQTLESKRLALNQHVATLNSLRDKLNSLAEDINSHIATFNTSGGTLRDEFEEGLYQSDAQGQRISIFQFTKYSELVRVIAHELGHALGMDHNKNPDSILYPLNTSKNIVPTQEDLDSLATACHFEPAHK